MKEVCGYKGLDSKFYETKKECKKADLGFKIRNIQSRLDNFEREVSDYFMLNVKGLSHRDFITNSNYIFNIVAKKVLENSDDFLEVISKKEDLKKELDELKKEQASESEWVFLKKWWLNYKWW